MNEYRKTIQEKLPNTCASAASGRSRSAAIKLMCLECVGGMREEVRRCTDSGCPLFPYRPYKEE